MTKKILIDILNTAVSLRLHYETIATPFEEIITEYVAVIAEIVSRLLRKCCPEDRLFILSYYKEERRILAELLHNVYQHKEIQI